MKGQARGTYMPYENNRMVKPKKVSYLDNLKKEIGDRAKASDKASRTNYEARYGVMGIKQPDSQARASSARKSLGKATGQLLGAVLQGRRYDDATGKQIKAAPATARKIVKTTKPAMPTTGPAVKVAKKAAAKKR